MSMNFKIRTESTDTNLHPDNPDRECFRNAETGTTQFLTEIGVSVVINTVFTRFIFFRPGRIN